MKLDVQTYVEKDQSNLKLINVGPLVNPQCFEKKPKKNKCTSIPESRVEDFLKLKEKTL